VKQAPVNALKPKQRTKLRIALGRIYYTLRRHLGYTSAARFAKDSASEQLPLVVFGHQTPLLRKLKGVDMWLQRRFSPRCGRRPVPTVEFNLLDDLAYPLRVVERHRHSLMYFLILIELNPLGAVQLASIITLTFDLLKLS